MKKWNLPALEELNITETAGRGQHNSHHNGRHDWDDRFPSYTPPTPNRPGCGGGSNGNIGNGNTGNGNTDNDDNEFLS